MNFRWRTLAASLAAWALGNLALNWVAGTDGTGSPRGATAGEFLAGWRAPLADILWLEANASLSSGDLATAEALLGAVTAVDPRPVYFWVNSARITACDIAAGRMAALGGASRLPAGVRRRIAVEQARWALRVLDTALQHHPESPALWIERANLQLGRLGDMDGAATSYRRAAALPGAPYFAARLHAELLRRLGRKQEALAWLIRLHPRLPADEPAAAADLVLARIHGLERELGVPDGRRYRRL